MISTTSYGTCSVGFPWVSLGLTCSSTVGPCDTDLRPDLEGGPRLPPSSWRAGGTTLGPGPGLASTSPQRSSSALGSRGAVIILGSWPPAVSAVRVWLDPSLQPLAWSAPAADIYYLWPRTENFVLALEVRPLVSLQRWGQGVTERDFQSYEQVMNRTFKKSLKRFISIKIKIMCVRKSLRRLWLWGSGKGKGKG